MSAGDRGVGESFHKGRRGLGHPTARQKTYSLLSSSSLRIASCTWRGMMRDLLLSRAALPASSRISALGVFGGRGGNRTSVSFRAERRHRHRPRKRQTTYRRGTRGRLRGRQGHHLRRAPRSVPHGESERYVPRETGVQPGFWFWFGFRFRGLCTKGHHGPSTNTHARGSRRPLAALLSPASLSLSLACHGVWICLFTCGSSEI